MALSARANYRVTDSGKNIKSFPVKDAEVIYHGAIVALDAGVLVKWDDSTTSATIIPCGMAMVTDQSDDKVTGVTDGSVECTVDIGGLTIKEASVTGASAQADVDKLVYASDDNTFTLTATAGSTPIGRLTRFVSSTVGDVQLHPFNVHGSTAR